jgi:AraC-like DNA-binding protein
VTIPVYEFAHGHVIPEHFHPEDQLVYASMAVMTVGTSQGTWVVPAHRAVWIPARTPHSIVMSAPVSMRTLYLRARMARRLPRTCCVVKVSSLLHELILHACTYPTLSRRSNIHAHLIDLLDLLIDQLETVQAIPLQLPNPSDARVAEILQRNPADSNSREATCRRAGASKRTIERIFQEVTRLSLGKWRPQLRLMRSLQLLAAGEKITHAALEAGYSTPGAFSAMFRRALATCLADTLRIARRRRNSPVRYESLKSIMTGAERNQFVLYPT